MEARADSFGVERGGVLRLEHFRKGGEHLFHGGVPGEFAGEGDDARVFERTLAQGGLQIVSAVRRLEPGFVDALEDGGFGEREVSHDLAGLVRDGGEIDFVPVLHVGDDVHVEEAELAAVGCNGGCIQIVAYEPLAEPRRGGDRSRSDVLGRRTRLRHRFQSFGDVQRLLLDEVDKLRQRSEGLGAFQDGVASLDKRGLDVCDYLGVGESAFCERGVNLLADGFGQPHRSGQWVLGRRRRNAYKRRYQSGRIGLVCLGQFRHHILFEHAFGLVDFVPETGFGGKRDVLGDAREEHLFVAAEF